MPRIVSMISSATEIVHALGALPWLVGRSHECDYPDEVRALPVCTAPRFAVDGDSREIDRLVRLSMAESISVYQVFDDVLERLQPTHILTQIHCEVCAVSLRDVERSVAARLASRPAVVSLQPSSLSEVWEDIRRVARSLEIEACGEQLVAQLQERMQGIADGVAAAPRPRLACIEWIEPLMPTANWMPELVEMAGAKNVEWHTWDDLAAADPDIILVMPCGFDLERAVSEMYWLAGRDGWPDLRAVRNGRVFVADGNQYFNRPGPRLVESLEILAGIVHPEVFAPRHSMRLAATPFENVNSQSAGKSHSTVRTCRS
jgi:iron complex transport system substrate-binding protein